MSQSDKGLLVSGFYSLPGGMDSGVDPSLLEPDKASFAVNCRFRGGIITHRHPFKKVILTFGDDAVLETRMTQGRFQVAGQYRPDTGVECILAMIGGRIFRFNVADDNSVQELTITQSILSTAPFTVPVVDGLQALQLVTTTGLSVNATVLFDGSNYVIISIDSPVQITVANIDGTPAAIVATGTPLFFYDLNPATVERAWYKQAENFAIFQNNQNLPLIYDGAIVRRAVSNPPGNEVPIGNIMEYAMQRLCVTLPDTVTFAIGDLVGSSSGNIAPQFRDSVLKFTQNTYQNSGRNFRVPQTCGGIKSMTAIPLLDGALNQGPLMVGTPEITFTVNLPTDASTWANLTSPIQTVSLINKGPLSDRGAVLVNGDIWYRRYDGWGSMVLARRDFNTWANTSKSAEMNRILAFDDSSLLQFENGSYFDGRLIKTASPGRSPFGVYHRGMIALDYDRVSGLRETLPPVYDGLWTGLNVAQFVSGTFAGVERCFAFSIDYAGRLELYEVLKEGEFDDYGTGPKVRITWPFETGVLGITRQAGGGPLDVKRLENGEIWIDELFGNGTIQVWYRPMGAACWTDWRTYKLKNQIEVCATTNVCSNPPTSECQDMREFKPQYRARLGFGKPGDTCDRNMDRPSHTTEGWQLRIECRGHFRVKGLKVYARPLPEPATEPVCCPAPETTTSTLFFNTEQVVTATCPSGMTGAPVTVTIAANTYAAATQAEANALALAAATSEANEGLVCTPP